MLIRTYWPSCDFFWTSHAKRAAIDSFWVECTVQEAQDHVLPLLESTEQKEANEFAAVGARIAAQLGNPARPYCFLVARDLSLVIPLSVQYPFANLWNGYSLFRPIAELQLRKLSDVLDVVVEETRSTD